MHIQPLMEYFGGWVYLWRPVSLWRYARIHPLARISHLNNYRSVTLSFDLMGFAGLKCEL